MSETCVANVRDIDVCNLHKGHMNKLDGRRGDVFDSFRKSDEGYSGSIYDMGCAEGFQIS